MIGKLLLIAESGILPFYLNQDEIDIDNDLLSGLCSAIYSFAEELAFPLKNFSFEGHQMIIEKLKHKNEKYYLMAALYDNYHIEEGIKNKLRYIFENYFEKYDFRDENLRISDPNLKKYVKDIMNDEPMKEHLRNNFNSIMEIVDPILREEKNLIYAYSLNSSCNNILYCNGSLDIFQNRTNENLMDIIKEYLIQWRFEKIPQGDQFAGQEMPTGLDLNDYVNTGEKMYGLVINTSINLKEEPNNELLLYLFGKNTLMRSCAPDIEVELRKRLSQT